MKKKIDNIEVIKFFNEGKSCGDISRIFGCDPETIRLRLKNEGIDTSRKLCDVKCVHCNASSRKEGKTVYGKQRYLCLVCDKIFVSDIKEQEEAMFDRHEVIKKMYLVGKLSTTEIGDKLGFSSTVPQRILKKYGLTRDISYAKELGFANKLGMDYDNYIKRLPVFKRYRKDVIKITKKQKIKHLPNSNKRGVAVNDGYHLDHKYSILEGFKNGISPDIIGNIHNLEFIPWRENIIKGSKCSITIEELLNI